MKKTVVKIVVLASLCVGVAYSFAGDEKDKKLPAMDLNQNAMMEAMMKFAAPGEHHEHLKPLAGNWKTTSKWWMGPGEPTISHGKCRNEWILGGRFLKMDFKGASEEFPFEGVHRSIHTVALF